MAASVFAGSVAVCFGLSALYHRVTWRPHVRLWMRRAVRRHLSLDRRDHTPICLLALEGAWRFVVLSLVWLAAAVAIVIKFTWVGAPKWLAAVIGIALGWAGVVLLPQLATRLHLAAIVLLAAGGIAYTVGAVIYARGRPDPVPTVFGYHEVFHARSRSSASPASTSRSRSS